MNEKINNILLNNEKKNKIKQNTRVVKFLESYNDFVNKTSERQRDYIREISNYLKNSTAVLNDLYHQSNDNYKIGLIYKRAYDVIDDKSSMDLSIIKKFFIGNNISVIVRDMNESQKLLYMDLSKKMHQNQDQFNSSLNKSLSEIDNKGLLLLDTDNAESVKKKYEAIKKNLEWKSDKIKSFINLNTSISDMIMDGQFFILYLIKFIRCLFNYISFFIATRIFVPIYEENVYDKKQNPPSLKIFLLIFTILDLSLNGFLLTILFLLKFIFKSQNNTFPIDYDLIIKYGIDYFSCTLITLTIGLMIGNVIKNKRYFAYKYEGNRGIRAYESMMWRVSIIVNMIPFFSINL